MTHPLTTITLAIFLVAAGSLTAHAQYFEEDGYGPPMMAGTGHDDHEMHGNHRQFQHEMAAELLELTEEQQEQIKAIREEEMNANEALRQKIREYQDQIQQLTDGGTFDEGAIRAIAAEKAKVQVELAVAKARMHSKIHAIMTPEQQALAGKLRALKMKKRGKGHRGPRSRGPFSE